MKYLIKIIIFYSFIILLMGGEAMAAAEEVQDIKQPGPNDFLIAPNAVIMPLERIVLVRKESDYCAIKFTRLWTGKTADDRYAEYESYYQDDKSGNFSKKNVQFRKDELDRPKPIWSIFGHPIFTGNRNIRCGPIRLWWAGIGSVYFYSLGQEEGDYGIELAPTPWTSISEVNVFDSRVKWYRFDEKRKDIIIPIDQLWEK